MGDIKEFAWFSFRETLNFILMECNVVYKLYVRKIIWTILCSLSSLFYYGCNCPWRSSFSNHTFVYLSVQSRKASIGWWFVVTERDSRTPDISGTITGVSRTGLNPFKKTCTDNNTKSSYLQFWSLIHEIFLVLGCVPSSLFLKDFLRTCHLWIQN